ncbi:MAG: hypothetical protein FJX62_20560 [Alphaproteobacteria bacterium]|nr:hypothetical protein [Alphaproteobacteria bacterium]
MQTEQSAAAIVARYPGPIVLKPDVRKWRLFLAFNLAFVAIGLVMLAQGHRNGLYVAIAFGIIALFLSMVALPGAARLIVERDGFKATVMYRGKFTRWADVSEFQVAQMASGRQFVIVFDDATLNDGGHVMAGTKIAGRNSALPGAYGLPAEDLARVLNHWRSRAPGSSAPA